MTKGELVLVLSAGIVVAIIVAGSIIYAIHPYF
jgi:cell division protein FtsL